MLETAGAPTATFGLLCGARLAASVVTNQALPPRLSGQLNMWFVADGVPGGTGLSFGRAGFAAGAGLGVAGHSHLGRPGVRPWPARSQLIESRKPISDQSYNPPPVRVGDVLRCPYRGCDGRDTGRSAGECCPRLPGCQVSAGRKLKANYGLTWHLPGCQVVSTWRT